MHNRRATTHSASRLRPSRWRAKGLPVYSSDGEKVGVVKSVEKNADGSVGTLQADIEGFLGLGTSSVRFTADQLQQAKDRVVLTQTADEVRGVPSPSHESFDRGG
jgi:hypothetical protein